ncbi:holin family protein [Vibrio mediterranei]|uniref:3TM-type holin n=1 Tax=Vibrio mediterranei TaxID=689 RepID=UPI001EFEEC99|nr:3TM-type holin [Vibrio mediterranei]MCG9624181.1 holin family protein [Vibrio mediterranei]
MWESVKSLIATAAPMIGTVIGGPAGGAVGAMVASTLGVENTPEAIEQELRNNPDALLKLKQLESDERIKLQELALSHSKIESEERKLAITTQAATQQAELASNDAYVRRWRPTFGYAMCLAWSLLFFGLAFAVVFHPEQAASVVNSVVALTPLFSVALAVLGISIHKRSQDKQVAQGTKPAGFIGSLRQAVTQGG